MNKKKLIQSLLIILIVLISWLFYFFYLKKDLPDTLIDNTPKKETNNSKNLIKNLVYESKDGVGRKYIIKSNEGVIEDENTNVISMTDVTAQIILLDGSIVYISAKNAIYNSSSYNTKFEENVKLNYLEHVVKSDNLDLLFDINILEAYNNLVYKNLDITMYADKLELDLISKDSKIYNFDKGKVKIISIK